MLKILAFLSSMLLIGCAVTPTTSSSQYYQVETTKPYDEILAELEIAIAEHNFRITGHSRVGKVIRERGATDYPEYDTLQFCNLTHAKTVLDISPHAIMYMPCNIVVYQFAGKNIVKTHILPTDGDNAQLNRFFQQMNSELKQIVDFAVEQ